MAHMAKWRNACMKLVYANVQGYLGWGRERPMPSKLSRGIRPNSVLMYTLFWEHWKISRLRTLSGTSLRDISILECRASPGAAGCGGVGYGVGWVDWEGCRGARVFIVKRGLFWQRKGRWHRHNWELMRCLVVYFILVQEKHMLYE